MTTSTKVSDFKAIILKLASPENILDWSYGEVTKPETINYRTQRAEKDGLFCEKIFGPEKDWECYCGKYRRIRYKGIICDKCGVEVTRSLVRRERMGHIELAVPVSHIWFLRGIPSKMGLILDRSIQELERVIYFAGYVVTKINEDERKKVIEEIKKEYKQKLRGLTNAEIVSLKGQRDRTIRQIRGLFVHQIISEIDYRDFSIKYGQIFEAGTGAETLRSIFEKTNLESLAKELIAQNKKASSAIKKKISKRLRLIDGMIRAKIKPEWMFLTVLPVLPPDLRPMVQLDGGRYATSDVNDLYRRVINRNNRLKKLIELNAPEVICRNEKRMLQEAVDALIDNSSRRGQVMVAASTGQKRVLKSLADMLKGKQGRFRQNLLGKRVDYSGRSVIVVGPDLKLNQCGLPKYMALELFKPFVINKLVDQDLAHNVRGAGRLIEEEIDEVWAILEEVTKDRCVLLNRAPTLHRLGIQAFKPVLVEGNAIQLHPLVCQAFNADFDGDQMAVHLPLSDEAQNEAKGVMLSSNNLLKPATGVPVAVPSKDMVLGCYWMTKIRDGLLGQGKIFTNYSEALLAKTLGYVHLKAKIKVRMPDGEIIETSIGRIIFNESIPKGMGFINKTMRAKDLRKIISEVIDKFGIKEAAKILDKIKRMGFKYATTSGVSWGMDDIKVPKEKTQWLKEVHKDLELVQNQYNEGLLTDGERKSRVIELWNNITERIAQKTPETLDPHGSVFNIFDSKARGSLEQLRQMSGMKGLVVDPTGEIIELPIRNSYKEGLSVLEYFISTHGGRKGMADTALKTATAGYLTRRLVDVCQDVVVRQEDCGDKKGIYIYREDEEDMGNSLSLRIIGRISLEKIDGIVKSGQLIDKETALKIDEAGVDKLNVRSTISCQSTDGICQKCYGYDLGRNEMIKMGEAIGIVTAQAIGEPGTQLTLRTFHTGGVVGGGDITQGLPRVEEIFEARPPKGKAVISEVDGQISQIDEQNGNKVIQVELSEEAVKSGSKKPSKNKKKIIEYTFPTGTMLLVDKGDLISKGQQLNEGHIDLKNLYKVADREAVQRYIIREVQKIYTFAGENINDKHIEMIIRQMFSRLKIITPGGTNLLAGEMIEWSRFQKENKRVMLKKGGEKATAETLLLGVTKVSLTTESFLSAASFIETTRVLIDAAIAGKRDNLKGLKENVIIGKLIPAGTGYTK
ncbi:DNA-directed RNA polymerase subunit beta' [Patescibacteria group bacterium]|nr:DNA-directed RNA polymerase subunit beta' [Patescibacteria group bacterium]MBU1563877.1 DNA-directed RNA polymerase subunit beta' [Patescibacteria group bacterium]